jgi:hypothetical protein
MTSLGSQDFDARRTNLDSNHGRSSDHVTIQAPRTRGQIE